MARSAHSRPGRSLVVLVLLFAALYGAIAAGVQWSNAQWAPKLALDLEGGVEIVLKPVPVAGVSAAAIDANTISRAVEIIRQRVNGSGVSEAEVTTQGGQNIVVSLPGKPDQQTLDLVKRAARLEFRAVLIADNGGPTPTTTPTPSPTGSPSPTGTGKPTTSATTKPSSKPSATLSSASPTAKTNGMAVPAAVRQALGMPKAATSPTATSKVSTQASPTGSPKTSVSSPPAKPTKPTDASDLNWIQNDQALYEKFIKLDCRDPASRQGGGQADPAKPLVTCSTDGKEKYVLGPAEVLGTDVASANAGLTTDSRGNVTGQWEVQLKFTGPGTDKFATVTKRLAAIEKTQARNRFGIVLDDLVISAPTTNEAIVAGDAQISGSFNQATATSLANQLKFGALPISFRVDTQQEISALLGKEQLERGLLAGLIGLILVVLYSLAQYRLLGTVTIASLAIAGGLTFGTVALLGWTQGYRLSLPGVTGLIVAIGITADSFIVYFERVRDEVREGRSLLAAVEVGWQRARRTIIASDAVSFLAALVLYVLAVGSVQGFAFTLGLTTLIDIIVVFLFTKPVVTLLARTRFFGQGHPLSGFDAAHLGRDVRYAGRGKVRPPSGAPAKQTIAQRRAAAAAEAEDEAADGDERRNGSEIAEAGAGRAAGARRES